jgi:hypothetical protein
MPTHIHEISNLLTPKESIPDDNGWKGRHMRACRVHPVALMITALHAYVVAHESRYGSKVASDNFLWGAVLNSLTGCRSLLNGEIGGLDGGTCDAALSSLIEMAGWSPDTLEPTVYP